MLFIENKPVKTVPCKRPQLQWICIYKYGCFFCFTIKYSHLVSITFIMNNSFKFCFVWNDSLKPPILYTHVQTHTIYINIFYWNHRHQRTSIWDAIDRKNVWNQKPKHNLNSHHYRKIKSYLISHFPILCLFMGYLMIPYQYQSYSAFNETYNDHKCSTAEDACGKKVVVAYFKVLPCFLLGQTHTNLTVKAAEWVLSGYEHTTSKLIIMDAWENSWNYILFLVPIISITETQMTIYCSIHHVLPRGSFKLL